MEPGTVSVISKREDPVLSPSSKPGKHTRADAHLPFAEHLLGADTTAGANLCNPPCNLMGEGQGLAPLWMRMLKLRRTESLPGHEWQGWREAEARHSGCRAQADPQQRKKETISMRHPDWVNP